MKMIQCLVIVLLAGSAFVGGGPVLAGPLINDHETGDGIITTGDPGFADFLSMAPSTVLRVNGSTAPVSLTSDDPIQLSLSLDAGDFTGQTADYWLVWAGENLLYSFGTTGGWASGLLAAATLPLFDFDSLSIPGPTLSPGAYVFYFGVDLTADGQLNSPLYYDSVAATVTGSSGPGGEIANISTVEQLLAAVEAANQGGSIDLILADGTYRLPQMLWVSADNVHVRSASGNRDSVILQGDGMTGSVSQIFGVAGKNFTVENLTLSLVSTHAIQVHGELDADNVAVKNVRFTDTGEQMLKVSVDVNDLSVGGDNGLVENCLFEYTAGVGPQYYIGGIDAHNADSWIVRNNVFISIKSPADDMAEHAIHFWNNSRNTLVEKNRIINCDRGIGFGLGDMGHFNGIIRNNMIYHDENDAYGFGDVGIGLESAANVKVYNNTIYFEHAYPNAIEYRFGATSAFVANNLANRAIAERDGASGSLSDNLTSAVADWFVDSSSGDLHLSGAVSQVTDQGVGVEGLTDDFDGDARPQGMGVDIGADEWTEGRGKCYR